MDNEIDFKKGKEQENIKLVKEFFQKSIKSEGEEKSENFGKALGYLWNINDNRSSFSKFFKNSKTGLGPVVKKIEEFVDSGAGFEDDDFLELLKVLIKSSSINKGILGKNKVLDASKEMVEQLKGVRTNANGTEGKEKKKTKNGVWSSLNADLDTNGVNKMTELSPETMLYNSVKEGINAVHEDKNKKITKNISHKEDVDKKNKKQKGKNEEKKTLDLKVYKIVYEQICKEGQSVKEDCLKIKQKMQHDTQFRDLVDYEEKGRLWFEKRLQSLEKVLSTYPITKNMSEASKKRGLIFGFLVGLTEVLSTWLNKPEGANDESGRKKNYMVYACGKKFKELEKSHSKTLEELHKLIQSDQDQNVKDLSEQQEELWTVINPYLCEVKN